MTACGIGNVGIVELLLEHGEDPTFISSQRYPWDAVGMAVMSNHDKFLKCLFDHSSLNRHYIPKSREGSTTVRSERQCPHDCR